MRTPALVALMLFTVAPAHADQLYSYIGDAFHTTSGVYTSSDRITGSLIVVDGFVPDPAAFSTWVPGIRSWIFTDGHQTFTELNSVLDFVSFGERSDTAPDRWFFDASNGDGGHITTIRFGDYGDSAQLDGSNFGFNNSFNGGAFGTWTVQTVSVPELAILPRLPRLLKFGTGLGLEAALTARLQRVTAWGAAIVLRAIWIPVHQRGIYLDLPRVRVEVVELCSGLQTMLLMLAAAALIAAVLPARRLPWALALLVAAVLLALEANALRVAGIAIGLEEMGAMTRAGKDWIQLGTTGVALVQLMGLGRLIARGHAVPQPVSV